MSAQKSNNKRVGYEGRDGDDAKRDQEWNKKQRTTTHIVKPVADELRMIQLSVEWVDRNVRLREALRRSLQNNQNSSIVYSIKDQDSLRSAFMRAKTQGDAYLSRMIYLLRVATTSQLSDAIVEASGVSTMKTEGFIYDLEDNGVVLREILRYMANKRGITFLNACIQLYGRCVEKVKNKFVRTERESGIAQLNQIFSQCCAGVTNIHRRDIPRYKNDEVPPANIYFPPMPNLRRIGNGIYLPTRRYMHMDGYYTGYDSIDLTGLKTAHIIGDGFMDSLSTSTLHMKFDHVTEIGNKFFQGSKLDEMNFRDTFPNVRSIGDEFMKSVTIRNSTINMDGLSKLESIGNNAFEFSSGSYMNNLSISISGIPKLRTIGNNFCHGAKLKNLTMTNLPSIENVGANFLDGSEYQGPLDITGLRNVSIVGDNFMRWWDETTMNTHAPKVFVKRMEEQARLEQEAKKQKEIEFANNLFGDSSDETSDDDI